MSRSLLAVLALAFLLLVAGPLVYDGARDDRLADGVRIAGVDVGGRTAGQARRLVAARVERPARRDVVVARDGQRFVLGAARSRVDLDVEASIRRALDHSRAGSPWSRTWRALTGGRVDADVPAEVRFDEAAVGAFVKRVGDVLDERARNADVDTRDGRLRVARSATGFRTDREALLASITADLRRPRPSGVHEVPGEVLRPRVTTKRLVQRHPLLLVVDRKRNRLRVYRRLEVARTYTISVGRAGHDTPAGRYEITSKETDPAWHVPDEPWAGELAGQTIPPGDPRNPLEARWLGIEDGVGIHGTTETEKLGRR
ncbi:MAG TPA: L,D-transpeptidase family protein, partial [Baekduia sp.]|nr:L,D-transpeptidase family protein [Baekduia sp.]